MKDRILMVVFVLVLGSVLTLALVAVDYYTLPLIEKNTELQLKSGVLSAFNVAFENDPDAVEKAYEENISERPAGDKTFYINETGDIAFRFSGSGLWGPITGVIALASDFKTVRNITVIHQEETPGLGSRIAEAPYLEGFVGKRFSPALELTQPGKGGGDTQIDSISGATMSSKAFVLILNAEQGRYRELLGGSR